MTQEGRPTKFKKQYIKQAYEVCARLGATNADLAALFEVSNRTIFEWQQRHPEFLHALKKGKKLFDDGNVRNALLKRALGYDYEGKHYPPDVTACIFWLKNRDPKNWRDKFDYRHEGKVDQVIKVQVFDEDSRER
jgi:hypothetical protein